MKLMPIPGIGEVWIRKDRRARRITIRVSAIRGVWVTLPLHQSFRDAEHAVNLKRHWITKAYQKATELHAKTQPLRDEFAALDATQAKRELTIRLGELAQQHGYFFHSVSVRNQRTRWGSCSSKRRISLNIKLMLLPQELRDYVMLHELVHTQVPDHGPAFYAELDRIFNNRRRLSDMLKRISLQEL